MKTVGIVAEYNPLHQGHLYQMQKAKELAGAESVVCVLSGDFVQRGEAAVYSKFARAEAAVRCGASLVLELPLPWCLASAGSFARGAVGLLGATGVVDALSFGCEEAELARLETLAEALLSPALEAPLKTALGRGLSYAAAREEALAALVGAPEAALLRAPNNILAVEYLKARRTLALSLLCCPVRRLGSEHDGSGSASSLRAALAAGESWGERVPEAARAVYARETAAGRGGVTAGMLDAALLARLRMLPKTAFAAVPDAAEGLENLLYAAVRRGGTMEEAAALCKSKRYALSRLRRMLLCAALGVERGSSKGLPPYLRVLAADERGCALLARMRKSAAVPVLTRGAQVRALGGRCEEIFLLGSRAHDLYVLAGRTPEARRGDGDFVHSPSIIC